MVQRECENGTSDVINYNDENGFNFSDDVNDDDDDNNDDNDDDEIDSKKEIIVVMILNATVSTKKLFC